MQELPEGMDTEPTSEQGVTQLSSSMEWLTLSQQREVQRIRDDLKDCALYSGVGVIFDVSDVWKSMEHRLSAEDYKIFTVPPFRYHHTTLFTTIAQSIAYPKPPAAAESSDSPPFVIAVFVSGYAVNFTNTLDVGHGPVDIVEDIIKPFLPQSAPHLRHIPKVFFISVDHGRDQSVPPPHFPDGNYCVAYHVTNFLYASTWTHHISDHLFLPGMSVQEVIKNSRSQLNKKKEQLHYFSFELVLKK